MSNHPATQTTTSTKNDSEFDRLNNTCTPQLIDYLSPTPQSVVIFIAEALAALGCDAPRPRQIDCVFELKFRSLDMMHITHKCRDGKSLFILAIGIISRSVTVAMVPLIGLGNDQISKTKRLETGAEACHVDEFRDEDFSELIDRLELCDPDDKTSIITHMHPHTK